MTDSFTELETLEIDTIEESDFETDFDFLSLENNRPSLKRVHRRHRKLISISCS